MIFGLPSVVFSSINGFERTRKQREFPKKIIIIYPTLAWGGGGDSTQIAKIINIQIDILKSFV